MILMGNSPDKAMRSAPVRHCSPTSSRTSRRPSAVSIAAARSTDVAFTEEHEVEAHAVEHEVEQEAEGQGAATATGDAHDGYDGRREKAHERRSIEKIKARVLEHDGRSRAQSVRYANGSYAVGPERARSAVSSRRE